MRTSEANWTKDAALLEALTCAREKYSTDNPVSERIYNEAMMHMPGGNTRTVLHYAPFPLTFAKGYDATLQSADGGSYTDLLGEYTAGLYGHSHPVIMDAIRTALDGGIGLSGRNMMENQLAALMCSRFPSLDLVRFTNSGTEANMMALAAATAFTGRRKVLVFHGGYHGSVFTFAGGGSPINARHDFLVCTYNDVRQAEDLIRQHRDDLAAVLVEPMMGAGGCIPASQEFLSTLRSESLSAGTILILDEVMTSRLDSGGLQRHYGLKPDLTTFGKYLAGGMSFGAFGGRRDLMVQFDPTQVGSFPHSGTFNNNVLSMAAGVAGLKKVLTPERLAQLNADGDALRANMNTTFESACVGMQVTGIGSVMTVHAVSGEIRSSSDLERGDQNAKELFFFDMIAEGFWLARRGMITLSLPITCEDLDRFTRAVERFVERRKNLLPAAT